MNDLLIVQYWITEHGVFARIPEKRQCLSAESLAELAALAENLRSSEKLTFIPGDPLPDETPTPVPRRAAS